MFLGHAPRPHFSSFYASLLQKSEMLGPLSDPAGAKMPPQICTNPQFCQTNAWLFPALEGFIRDLFLQSSPGTPPLPILDRFRPAVDSLFDRFRLPVVLYRFHLGTFQGRKIVLQCSHIPWPPRRGPSSICVYIRFRNVFVMPTWYSYTCWTQAS